MKKFPVVFLPIVASLLTILFVFIFSGGNLVGVILYFIILIWLTISYDMHYNRFKI